jgi:hypothetical protein
MARVWCRTRESGWNTWERWLELYSSEPDFLPQDLIPVEAVRAIIAGAPNSPLLIANRQEDTCSVMVAVPKRPHREQHVVL